MDARESSEASGQPASSELLIRQFLVKASIQFDRSLEPELVQVWLDSLGGIEPKLLGAALKNCLDTCTRFPVPGNVREFLTRPREMEKAEQIVASCEAERAWDRTMAFVEERGEFELPSPFIEKGGNLEYRGQACKPLGDEIAESALRSAGGKAYLRTCSAEDLKWARKTFLETYEKFRREPEAHIALDSLPASLRENLRALGERKKLQ